MLSVNVFNHVYDHSYNYKRFSKTYMLYCCPLIGSKASMHSALNQAEFVALRPFVDIKVSFDYSKLALSASSERDLF